MCLTEKEKRVITSPFTFSKNKKKDTRYRAKMKIHGILQDMQFILEYRDKISSDFGINVYENNSILECFSETENPKDKLSKNTTDKHKSSHDQDLL